MEKEPYYKAYYRAKSRCAPTGSYKKRGIKCLLSIKDIRYLWFRDKAYLMKEPTIHRKVSSKGYTKENCQYLERKIHGSKHGKESWKKIYQNPKICKQCGKLACYTSEICSSCYKKNYNKMYYRKNKELK